MNSMSMARKGQFITQGDYAIAKHPEDVISTILGSCVAVCLWDAEAGIGGMNHILLPGGTGGGGLTALGVGASDMERLRNGVLKAGGAPNRLRAKVFGGASMVQGLSDIGARNTEFVHDFLRTEGIPCLAESTGGTRARHIRFWPHSGRVQLRFVAETEIAPPDTSRIAAPNDVELFD